MRDGEGAHQAPDPGVPHQRRDPEFRQRQGRRALRPRRRDHARPRDPHQTLAADRAGAGRPASSTTSRAPRTRPRKNSSPTTRPISRATRSARTAPPCTIRRRASCWCRGSACSGWAPAPRTPASPPTSREAAVEGITDAEAIGRFTSISPKPTCSIANIGRWNWPSWARAKPCRSQARSRSSPAPAAPSAPPPRKAFAAAGAEVALLDHRCEAPRAEQAKAIGGTAHCDSNAT